MEDSKDEIERKLVNFMNKSREFDIDAYLMEETYNNEDMLKKLLDHIEFEGQLKNTLQSKILIELDLANEAKAEGKEFDQLNWKLKMDADHEILRLIKKGDELNKDLNNKISLYKQALRFKMEDQKLTLRKYIINLINEKKKIDQQIGTEMMKV